LVNRNGIDFKKLGRVREFVKGGGLLV